MIGPWIETQPERVRCVLDPSWSPVRAAVVLAARHEQEAVADLDAFFSPNPARNPTFWSQEFLGNLVPARCFAPDAGVVPPWRAEQLSEELALETRRADDFEEQLIQLETELDDYRLSIARALGMTRQAEGHEEQPCSDDQAAIAILDARARIDQLEADLATARAAMGPLGDPLMPEPCECNWPDACVCGADENLPLPERFLFGVPPEHQPPPHHTEIPFPLPNDPRLP